jgi:3-oxoadipate enol-lactonase
VRITVDDGVELAVLDSGSGLAGDRPTFVLVHGFGGGMVDFADHVDAFAATHRVITFDLRGHGASDGPDDPERYSLDRFARDVVAVVDALGVDQFRLLGHSMGGMIARRVASTHGHRLDALVLMNTAPGPVPGIHRGLVALAAQLAADEGMSSLKVLLDAASPLATPAHRRLVAERPDYVEMQERRFAALSAAMWSTIALEMCDQPDESSVLERLDTSTLVVVGELDELFLEPSRRTAALMSQAQLAIIPASGHSPQFENPPAWFAAVDDFLRNIEGIDD